MKLIDCLQAIGWSSTHCNMNMISIRTAPYNHLYAYSVTTWLRLLPLPGNSLFHHHHALGSLWPTHHHQYFISRCQCHCHCNVGVQFLWPFSSLFYFKEPIACCLFLKLCEKKIICEVNLSKQNACCEASENIRYDTLRQAWKMLCCNYRWESW